jgi:hypothetical protein
MGVYNVIRDSDLVPSIPVYAGIQRAGKEDLKMPLPLE